MSKTIVLWSTPRSRSAFTLVELLVVVAIIGILASLIVGISGYASRKSDVSRAIGEIEQLKNAMEEYRIQYGSYWTNSGPVLNNKVGSGANLRWLTNELTKVSRDVKFIDPWGREYIYTNAGYRFVFWSKGPDSSTPDDDINSSQGTY